MKKRIATATRRKDMDRSAILEWIAKQIKRGNEINNAEHQRELELISSSNLVAAFYHQMESGAAYKIAEANLINAKTREQRARAEVIERALQIFDPAKLPKKYRKFILQNLLNPNSPQARDPETQEELDKSLIQKSKADADEATDQREFKKWKFDRERKKDL